MSVNLTVAVIACCRLKAMEPGGNGARCRPPLQYPDKRLRQSLGIEAWVILVANCWVNLSEKPSVAPPGMTTQNISELRKKEGETR